MACLHISIKRKTPGQQAKCISCGLDIIYNTNNKWVWLHSLSKKELAALNTVFRVDKIMGVKQ